MCVAAAVCQPPNSIELLMAIDANDDGVALWRLLLLRRLLLLLLLTTNADVDGGGGSGVAGLRPDVPARADDDADDDYTRPIQWQLYSLYDTG